MKVMMFMIPKVYQSDNEPGEDFAPDAAAVEAMTRFNERLAEAGSLILLDGLRPPSSGARISFGSGKPRVTRGPFAEAGEVVGGYWLLRVNDMDEAIRWAEQCPAAEGDVLEIRPIFEVEEMPEDVRKAAESTIVDSRITGV